jgi:cell wall-associated NlpC family hydrolase
MRKEVPIFLLVAALAYVLPPDANSLVHREFSTDYKSPYSVTFDMPKDELLAPDSIPPRDNPRLESKTPYDQWYSRRIRKRYGAWGPESRHYPGLGNDYELTEDWKRQRVLAVATELIGLPYQHHHIPDWNPPHNWPWKAVAYGRNSKGMDCSDFTGWVYNYGLGIHMSTGIRQQANAEAVDLPDGASKPVKKINDDHGYEDLIHKLRCGDLLYIKHKKDGKISHVIMWVGEHGHSPDGTPLVIDCTGPEHVDCNGNQIPIGVQLRPFGKHTWYYECFTHANRIF